MNQYGQLSSLGTAVIRACEENSETKALVEARIAEHQLRTQNVMTMLKERVEPLAKVRERRHAQLEGWESRVITTSGVRGLFIEIQAPGDAAAMNGSGFPQGEPSPPRAVRFQLTSSDVFWNFGIETHAATRAHNTGAVRAHGIRVRHAPHTRTDPYA